MTDSTPRYAVLVGCTTEYLYCIRVSVRVRYSLYRYTVQLYTDRPHRRVLLSVADQEATSIA